MGAIEKEYKEKRIHLGSEYQRRARIPFDSVSLNLATGGGVPLGVVSRLWGNYSAGKTYNSLILAKNAQNLHHYYQQIIDLTDIDELREDAKRVLDQFPEGLTVAYYNVEGGYDKVFAEKIGVDTSKLYIVEGKRIEELAETMELSLGAIHFHIIDSASAAVPIDRLENDMTDWDRGLHARVWNKALDHIQDKVDGYENSILILDQVRVNQNTGTDMAAGGKKMDHASHLTVQLKRGKWLYKRDGILTETAPSGKQATISGKAEADGYQIIGHVKKSRVGRPLRLAYLDLDLDNMKFDTNVELAKAASFLGLAELSGSWFELSNGEKVQGINKLSAYIQENVDFKQEVLKEIYKYMWENP